MRVFAVGSADEAWRLLRNDCLRVPLVAVVAAAACMLSSARKMVSSVRVESATESDTNTRTRDKFDLNKISATQSLNHFQRVSS